MPGLILARQTIFPSPLDTAVVRTGEEFGSGKAGPEHGYLGPVGSAMGRAASQRVVVPTRLGRSLRKGDVTVLSK